MIIIPFVLVAVCSGSARSNSPDTVDLTVEFHDRSLRASRSSSAETLVIDIEAPESPTEFPKPPLLIFAHFPEPNAILDIPPLPPALEPQRAPRFASQHAEPQVATGALVLPDRFGRRVIMFMIFGWGFAAMMIVLILLYGVQK